MVMANLAQQFLKQDTRPVILTASWDPDWPSDIVHREVSVVRLPQPRTRAWGTWQYMRRLSRWLLQNRDRYDLIFVSMLKHSAYVAITVGQKLGVHLGSADCLDVEGQRIARQLLKLGLGRVHFRTALADDDPGPGGPDVDPCSVACPLSNLAMI